MNLYDSDFREMTMRDNNFLTKLLRAGAFAALACLLAVPAVAQTYNYFPSTAAEDDGRTVALAGDNIATLAQDSLTFIIAVPPGVSQFELGVFDGETGLTDGSGQRHWDNGTTQLQYALFYDPLQQGSTDPANLVGVWRGNQSNPTVDPGGAWVASSPTFPNNGWWNLNVNVPVPPVPDPGQAPSGATFYHLCISYRGVTGGVISDPCTGDPRPADASPSTIANFKLRATTNIAVLSFAFAYEGAMRTSGNRDVFLIYPQFNGSLPSPDFFLTTPTTYDGSWSFDLDVPTSQTDLILYGGDFDFGTDLLVGFPSGAPVAPCADTDDPDTPNDAFFPPFAVGPGGVRLDDSLPEGARPAGSPPDDNRFDVFRRSPCVRWTLTSPGADGEIGTPGDNVVYANNNPSSQREWEQFRISSEPTCDASPTCDPSVSNCADFCAADLLPGGIWRVTIEGVDLSNLNAWRSDNLAGFCVNCGILPRPYLVGDTVFHDVNGNGLQDPGEPGISGVLVELLDSNGRVVNTVLTGDPGSYSSGMWEACQERNTGTGTAVDDLGLYCFDVAVVDRDPQATDTAVYTVRIAGSNFLPGGALHDFFGGEPEASRQSPTQTDTVVEGGGNVMTYDFGYFVPLGSLGDRVWLDEDADGVQDPGEPGINGVTVTLLDADGNVVATQVTAGDGEYLFEGLEAGTYTVQIDASTLPAGLTQTYDLDGLITLDRAAGALAGGENRRDFDFGYTPCGDCQGKVSYLEMVYLGDQEVYVTVTGRRGPIKNDPLFSGFVDGTDSFAVAGPNTGNGGFRGTLGTEITVSVDGAFNTQIHTSCSQPIGPGMIFGDFLIVYAESKEGGALCPMEGGDGGGGGGGGGDGGGAEGTGTIGYWKNHAEAWPVDELTLGGVVYSQAEALAILRAPVRGDITVALAQQLIAAKLNVEIGNESSCIDGVIVDSDAYLVSYPVGSKPKGGAKNAGNALKDTLDAYNNGLLCAPHRG